MNKMKKTKTVLIMMLVLISLVSINFVYSQEQTVYVVMAGSDLTKILENKEKQYEAQGNAQVAETIKTIVEAADNAKVVSSGLIPGLKDQIDVVAVTDKEFALLQTAVNNWNKAGNTYALEYQPVVISDGKAKVGTAVSDSKLLTLVGNNDIAAVAIEKQQSIEALPENERTAYDSYLEAVDAANQELGGEEVIEQEPVHIGGGAKAGETSFLLPSTRPGSNSCVIG